MGDVALVSCTIYIDFELALHLGLSLSISLSFLSSSLFHLSNFHFIFSWRCIPLFSFTLHSSCSFISLLFSLIMSSENPMYYLHRLLEIWNSFSLPHFSFTYPSHACPKNFFLSLSLSLSLS